MLAQQVLQDFQPNAQRQRPGHQRLGQFGRHPAQPFEQLLRFIVAEQFVRMLLHDMVEVRRDDNARIDHRVAKRLRPVAIRVINPHRWQTERRLLRLKSVDHTEHFARIDREQPVDVHLRLTSGHSHERDAINRRPKVEVVPDVHRRHEKAQLGREFLAHAFDARQQLTTLVAIHECNEPKTDLQTEHVYWLNVIPRQIDWCLGAVTARG